jgi:hypothetical protein
MSSSGTGSRTASRRRGSACGRSGRPARPRKIGQGLVTPKARMNERTAVNAVSPKLSVARSGRTVRSWPIIPPTRPLTPASSANWPAFPVSRVAAPDRERRHRPSGRAPFRAETGFWVIELEAVEEECLHEVSRCRVAVVSSAADPRTRSCLWMKGPLPGAMPRAQRASQTAARARAGARRRCRARQSRPHPLTACRPSGFQT